MTYLRLFEVGVFAMLSILGIFGIHYSFTILRVLIKHKKDKAPLTSYFLNPQMAKIPYVIYAGFFGFLTGVMAFLGYVLEGPNSSIILQYIVFLSGFVFAMFTTIFIVLELKFWYVRFKRFL